MYPIWLLEKFHEHDMKLGQAVLDLIDGSLWEITSWGMKEITMRFSIVSDQDRAFTNYLKVGPFMSDFTPPPPSQAHVCDLSRNLCALGK